MWRRDGSRCDAPDDVLPEARSAPPRSRASFTHTRAHTHTHAARTPVKHTHARTRAAAGSAGWKCACTSAQPLAETRGPRAACAWRICASAACARRHHPPAAGVPLSEPPRKASWHPPQGAHRTPVPRRSCTHARALLPVAPRLRTPARHTAGASATIGGRRGGATRARPVGQAWISGGGDRWRLLVAACRPACCPRLSTHTGIDTLWRKRENE